MAGYKRAGPHKPTGGRGFFPHSPGVIDPTVTQFRDILVSVIKQGNTPPRLIPGLEAALALYQGYFGIFGGKEEK